MRTVSMLLLVGLLLGLCAVSFAQVPPVEFHGYIQNRLYTLPGDPTFFQVERVSLSAKACLPGDSIVYIENYWHPAASGSGLYIESAYGDMPLGVGRIRIGKGRNQNFAIVPTYPNRKTSNYGLVQEEFTQDRIYGVQYMVQGKPTEYGVTVDLGPRVTSRNFGDPGVNSIPHFADRDLPGDLNRNLNVSARVSHRFNDSFRAGASAQVGALTNKDITGFNTLFGTAFTGDDRSRLALDATYKSGSLFLQSEAFFAKTSDMDHSAWYVLGGWEPANPKAIRFYARYGQADYDVPVLAANPITWDKRQTTLSAVLPISKGIWLQLEHEINDEKQFSADNNVTFLELFTGF